MRSLSYNAWLHTGFFSGGEISRMTYFVHVCICPSRCFHLNNIILTYMYVQLVDIKQTWIYKSPIISKLIITLQHYNYTHSRLASLKRLDTLFLVSQTLKISSIKVTKTIQELHVCTKAYLLSNKLYGQHEKKRRVLIEKLLKGLVRAGADVSSTGGSARAVVG